MRDAELIRALDLADVSMRAVTTIGYVAPSVEWLRYPSAEDEPALAVGSAFRSAVERAGLELTVECPPLDAPIWVDRGMWEKVVLNLVSNAFKFTAKGSVSLRIHSAEGSPLRAGSQWMALSVTDTGIGIAEDKQRIIFEAFQQADGTTSRKYGGTGLGLYIARRLARAMGGELSVDSAPGQGARFTFTLPSRVPAQA